MTLGAKIVMTLVLDPRVIVPASSVRKKGQHLKGFFSYVVLLSV